MADTEYAGDKAKPALREASLSATLELLARVREGQVMGEEASPNRTVEMARSALCFQQLNRLELRITSHAEPWPSIANQR